MSIPLEEGMLFADRYQVVRCLATGGMGAVYEVIHLETNRRRALKVMLPHTLASAELDERFRREARITGHIESEFIVDVFDAGVDDVTEMPFLVMELLKGEELGAHLERVGKLAAEDVVTYLHQVALALDKTHAASIVHRDLKPENLFLTRREDGAPRIKILDFGIAKLVDDGIAKAQVTRSVGTPLYMSPEQFENGQRLSGASDIYSLGMLAYTLLVGVAYWDEEASRDSSVFALARVVALGPREKASARAKRRGLALPAGFDVWFQKITSMEPEDRFPTAAAAVDALAVALGVASPAWAHPPSHPAASGAGGWSPGGSHTPGASTVTTSGGHRWTGHPRAVTLAAAACVATLGAVTLRALVAPAAAERVTTAYSLSAADGTPEGRAAVMPAPAPSSAVGPPSAAVEPPRAAAVEAPVTVPAAAPTPSSGPGSRASSGAGTYKPPVYGKPVRPLAGSLPRAESSDPYPGQSVPSPAGAASSAAASAPATAGAAGAPAARTTPAPLSPSGGAPSVPFIPSVTDPADSPL